MNSVPFIIALTFLLLTLMIGLLVKKPVTFREYAVGNKKFETATLVATLLASNFGGGLLIRNVEQIYAKGIYWAVAWLGGSLSYWIISPLALRMAPFMHHLSIVETIGKIYGKYPRILAAFSCIGASIGSIAIQINVISTAISICVNPAQYYFILLLATFIIIFYSSLGGVRAVTLTDVLQFITFALTIPLLAVVLFQKIGKPIPEIYSILQNHEKFSLLNLFHLDTNLILMLIYFLCGIASHIEPTMLQRVYMASGPLQAYRVLMYSGIFGCIICIPVVLIGILIFVADPSLPLKEVWPYLMTHLPIVFKGCLIISLLAMSMSTADSKLNACAIIISHDILECLGWNRNLNYTCKVWVAKLSSVVIGLAAMIVTYYYKNLLELMRLIYSFSLPIITVPFVLIILGFRGSSRTALIGMIAGILTTLIWKQWVEPTSNIPGEIFGMVANGLAMMGVHYLSPKSVQKGWAVPEDKFKIY